VGTTLCERFHLRLQFDRVGQRTSRLVEITLEAECARKPEMNIPIPRILGTRSHEQISCLIHMAQKEMARAQCPIMTGHIRVTGIESDRFLYM
jgi:hypothetical protein